MGTKTPKQIIQTFKEVSKEASEFYDKPPHELKSHEFVMHSRGRLSQHVIARLGGFTKLKTYCYPSKAQPIDKETRKLMERILGL